jgi:hypothetical protein
MPWAQGFADRRYEEVSANLPARVSGTLSNGYTGAMAEDHNRAIAHAAKAALSPLGFRRKGRSRLWFADHGWWLLLVEFQPSAWSKGSYLNVAPHWLWHPAANDAPRFHMSFDYGPVRFAPFVALEQAMSFGEIDGLVAAAFRASADFASELDSIEAAADATWAQAEALRAQRRPAHWPAFHAGMAAGLAGRPSGARAMFEAVLATEAPPGSVMHPAAKRFLAMVDRVEAFRAAAEEAVVLRRAGLKLPPLIAPRF